MVIVLVWIGDDWYWLYIFICLYFWPDWIAQALEEDTKLIIVSLLNVPRARTALVTSVAGVRPRPPSTAAGAPRSKASPFAEGRGPRNARGTRGASS